MLNFHWIADLR